MNIISLVGIGIIMCVLIVTVKQFKPEFALLLSIVCGITLTAFIIVSVIPLLDEIRQMGIKSGLDNDLIFIAIKAVGICIAVQLATDICRDAGQSSLASKLEIGGKAALLIIAIPIFEQMLSIAVDIMGG